MYYLIFGIIYLISLLPLRILYWISDLTYLILYKGFGYRKEIVFQNLSRSFPAKSREEIQQIQKDFYRSFCDQWVETIKLVSLPLNKLKQHLIIDGSGLQEAMKTPSKKIIVLLGHQFNWEMANQIGPAFSDWQYAGIYLPLSAKIFDRLILKIRSRTGSLMISSKDMRAGLKQLSPKETIIGFVADQTPPQEKTSIWVNFLNQPTPFLNGPAKIARHQKAAIVWLSLQKKGRGLYRIHHRLGCMNAAEQTDREIVEGYAGFLEEQLREQPENWMWTHRRWKRKPSQEVLTELGFPLDSKDF